MGLTLFAVNKAYIKGISEGDIFCGEGERSVNMGSKQW